MALFPEIVLKGILKKIRQFGVIYIVLSLDVLFILEKMFSKGRSIQMNAWMSRLQSPAVRSRRLLQVKVSSRTWHKVSTKGRKGDIVQPTVETAVADPFSCEVTALQCSRFMKGDRVTLGRVCTQPVCCAPHAFSWKETLSALSLQSFAASLGDALVNTP